MLCSKRCLIDIKIKYRLQKRMKNPIEYAKSIGIGKRFLGATLKNFIGDESIAIRGKLKNLDKNILIESKKTGNGKTHLAVAIVKSFGLIDSGNHYFVNFSDMMMEIRHSFKDGGINEQGIIKKYCAYKMLVIDDIGAEKTSDYAVSVLYMILNKRYELVLPTIITTNMSSSDIIKTYGRRILSRLMGYIITLDGKDMRVRV